MSLAGGNPGCTGVVDSIRGTLAFAFIIVNSVLWCSLIFCLGLARLFVPRRGKHRIALGSAMVRAMDGWVVCARWMLRFLRICGVDQGDETGGLRRDGWYVVVSNHQTWADILVLVVALYGRIPQFKFFTKRELIWLPFLGLAMWFLEFPYVHRYSRERLEADPALRERDREATLRACKVFRDRPTSVLIFLEGTRFTAAKRDAQESPYQNLLTPKTGGLGLVLENIGDLLDGVVDVTIRYAGDAPGMWDFCCGRGPRVDVVIRPLAPPSAEPEAVRAWVDDLWKEKDGYLT